MRTNALIIASALFISRSETSDHDDHYTRLNLMNTATLMTTHENSTNQEILADTKDDSFSRGTFW